MTGRSHRPSAARAAALFVVVGGAVAALAGGTPDPWGVRVTSGSKITSEVGSAFVNDDADDFVIEAGRGQKITGTLTATTTALRPSLDLRRSDGSVIPVRVGTSPGLDRKEKGSKVTVSFTADRSDRYKFRVGGKFPIVGKTPTGEDILGDTPTKGPFSFSVAAAKLPKGKVTGLAPNGDGQIRVKFPAKGGATVDFALTFKGTPPSFRELLDAEGRVVGDFANAVKPAVGALAAKKYVIPDGLPFGDYEVVFDTAPFSPPTGVGAAYAVKMPKGEAPRKGAQSASEPFVLSAIPNAGGAGTIVTVSGAGFADTNAKTLAYRMFVGRYELASVAVVNAADPRQIRGTVPSGIPLGRYDLVVESSTGQPAVLEDGFDIVAPPVADRIFPPQGPTTGGFDLEITGSGFRPGRMGVLIEGSLVPVQVKSSTSTSITFVAPARGQGFTELGVRDLDSQLSDSLLRSQFEFLEGPVFQRLVPSLVPVLGGDTVFANGANLHAQMHVFLETTTEGVFEDVTPTGGFVNANRLRFITPIRPRGEYDVYVKDVSVSNAPESPRRTLTYFSFGDYTAQLGFGTGTDPHDAYTTATGDFDRDGLTDLFLCRKGGAAISATGSHTRVFHNDGVTGLSNVTASVMPANTADEDWRADRVWVTDVTQDGYPDILIATSHATFPADTKSRVRILKNEPRTGNSTNDRVFRDRTIDLMAPPRIMKRYSLTNAANRVEYVSDNWLAMDMWVGDLDGVASGPPEIIVTKDTVVNDDNVKADVFDSGVYCGNYCSTPGGGSIAYTFYWGGSRAFVWDANGNGGKGRYKFETNFFPRKSGVLVAQAIPGGGTTPACNAQTQCKGKFPPYIGQRIVGGKLNGDAKADVAVLHSGAVTQNGLAIASLQIGLNRADTVTGASLTDVTPQVTASGALSGGNSVAIGNVGYQADALTDPSPSGAVAMSVADGTTVFGSAMRIFQYVEPGTVGAIGTLSQIGSSVLPPATGTEKWQASEIRFLDIDGDGDEEMVMLANTAFGNGSSLRILRNVAIGISPGHFDLSLQGIVDGLATGSEHFEGDCLAIGDLSGDGQPEFIVSRTTGTSGNQTRAIQLQR